MIGFARLGLTGHQAAKLGYAINADHWGHGYATDVARTILAYGFQALRLHRITAAIGPDNAASIAVVERFGMQYEGRLRDHVYTNGAWRDPALSILAPEWTRRPRLTVRQRRSTRAKRPDHAAGTIAAMRDADTPPQEPADRPNAAARTPQEHAARIRAAAAEVYERVQEWRNTPGWQDTPPNTHRHAMTVSAVAALDALPEPETFRRSD